MAKDLSPAALGTSDVRWDLTAFYAGAEDAAIGRDLAALQTMLQGFERDFKGQLHTKLGAALTVYGDAVKLMTKLQAYFDLAMARDTADGVLRREASKVQEAMAVAQGTYLTFFDLEVAAMDDSVFEALMTDAVVMHHAPMLRQIRALGAHFLDEAVEKTLTLRSPFGPSEWSDMMNELDTQMRFEVDGKTLNLPETLHIMGEARESDVRARALKVLNEGLATQRQTYFMARTLNVVAGNNLANDDARGFKHPMEATNLNNMVDDATVQMLHDVVADKGAKLGQRFYKLKARLLKMDTLRWSDRNAPMPFAPDVTVTWDEACRIVKAAYRDFSPTLGDLVDTVLDARNGWVDGPPSTTKISGAFDYTTVTPEGARSYMLLNYLGSNDDVMTLAHELGHAVHGLLAAEAQGPLMWHAPVAYAETASIFAEMLTFEGLLATTDDPQVKLGMYMDKIMHFLNTVVRQINFSMFEQGFHAKRRDGKLTAEDFDGLWLETTRAFYGPEGEVFTYADIDHLWSYVSHFHAYRPFYVYAYAFGELFTQSLMATRGAVGESFEPLYLDLLRAGGTKDAVALMAPFGLNPITAAFWEKGIENSMGAWLAEAEKLADELGL